jgi:ribose transport system substrate-binding protein
MYHVNQRFSPELKKALHLTPVIAVDIPMTLTPYFGVNNREAGEMLGTALADWVDKYWQGQLDKLLVLVEARVLDAVRERVHSPVEVLMQRFPNLTDSVFYVDCGNTYTATLQNTTDVLSTWRDHNRIAIVGFNEDSTIGALDAAKSLGMSQQIVVGGHGASQMLMDRMKEPDTRLAATTAYYPEQYGEPLLDMALRVINKERSARTTYVPVDLLLTDKLSV